MEAHPTFVGRHGLLARLGVFAGGRDDARWLHLVTGGCVDSCVDGRCLGRCGPLQ